MIISASFRTDIPTFYGEWFQNRLAAGYCLAKNPYDGRFSRICLLRQYVDGFIFWTKNLGPFFSRLYLLKEQGFPFVVHYSITGYPRALEPFVLLADKAVAHLQILNKDFGRRVGVWRYDPIVMTSITDFAFHRSNFAKLAYALSGMVDEVIVSFMEVYKKTQRHLDMSAAKFGFQWKNPNDAEKREFLLELAQIADRCGLKFSLCAQRQYLGPGINDACCIDVDRLSEVSGVRLNEVKPGHRGKQCGCNQSRDIGSYDTCLHGCVYCYAVNSPSQAKTFFKMHDRRAESLDPFSAPVASFSTQCEMDLV